MPPEAGLSPLQRRILAVLSGIEPAWTLSGGGALCGYHLMHRTTRDLDLFWHGRERLDDLGKLVIDRLKREGLEVDTLHGSASFQRIRVSDAGDSVIVDLVADPLGTVEPPVTMTLAAGAIQVDTVHEILVNKLCALLGRSELRDLIDIRELIANGGDLDRALADAPCKDGGFSPLTLAWVLKNLPILAMCDIQGFDKALAERYVAFRDDLVKRITDAAAPGAPSAGRAPTVDPRPSTGPPASGSAGGDPPPPSSTRPPD
ncbi:MAG: nucleotidyl transferase AbiEii/AbiGii toxin family protein [Planctomycetes bacterium]|nr:nucleotidyl transferase AbiEii/AbiGii toxin family protein [Planctomycetota bacterium]